MFYAARENYDTACEWAAGTLHHHTYLDLNIRTTTVGLKQLSPLDTLPQGLARTQISR